MTHVSRSARRALLVGGMSACLALAACGAPAVSVQPTPNQTVAAQAPTTPTALPVTPTTAPTATPAFAAVNDLPPLTLDTAFGTHDLAKLHLDPARIRTVIATGDVIPGGNADKSMRERNDFVFPVAATKDLLRSADLRVINLEAPIIADCPTYYPQFTFCGRPPFMEALRTAGIDVATLENNHIDNYGQAGIAETKQRLQDAGIAWADRSTSAIKTVRGLRFGFWRSPASMCLWIVKR